MAFSFRLCSQEPELRSPAFAAVSLPDAPQPQVAALATEDSRQQDQQNKAQQNPPATPQSAPGTQGQAAPAQASPGSSSSQTPGSEAEKTQREKAAEQLKEQESQRIVGVLPQFNISYRADAAPLSASQKMGLAFRTAVDPATFGVAFIVAGLHEALDEDTGFGWGIEGYGKRSGAAYLDSFNGTIIGNGILPAILRQDPRYFRLGHGTVKHRILYALATNVICKGDKSRRWQPNISNVGGNIIAGAISNLYYPSSNSGWGQTIADGFTVTAEGGFGSVFNEFWPDISRKWFHKDPTNGLDAQMRARDAADKAAAKKAKDAKQNTGDAPK